MSLSIVVLALDSIQNLLYCGCQLSDTIIMRESLKSLPSGSS